MISVIDPTRCDGSVKAALNRHDRRASDGATDREVYMIISGHRRFAGLLVHTCCDMCCQYFLC